jgi:alpha-beta hydrolase superfamily lysophospholipase
MKRLFRRRYLAGSFFAALLAINALAFVQAWSMTHFIAGGERTQAPEQLSLGSKLWILLTGVRCPRPTNNSDPSDYGMAFQTRHLRENNVDLEIWTIPAPANPNGLVLMYHGYVSSKSSLLPAAFQFHQMGYEVELVDFRGSGGSSGNATTIGYREADDVAATVADARRTNLAPKEPIILYGQSMGAAAALRAVGDLNTQVDGIIAESCYDRLISTAVNRFHVMHLPSFPLAQLLVFYGGSQQGYSGFAMNPADFAGRVHCPVLMFQGGLDTRVTNIQARNIFDNLAGPKKLEIFENADHCGFLSNDPLRWTTAVSTMLKSCGNQK